MEETKHISIPQVIKSYPTLAAAASFFQAGLGQVLCGKIKRGILILVFSLLATISYSVMQTVLFLLNASTLTVKVWQFMHPISTLISLFIRIWAVYDAYRIASDLKNVE